MQELREIVAATDRQLQETSREVQRTSLEVKQTSREVRNLGRQIGELTNGWGRCVESLVHPGVGPALRRFGYQVERVAIRVKSHRGNNIYEVNTLAIAQDRHHQRVVIAAQVRSHLDIGSVKEWLLRLEEFFQYFPEYRNHKLEGMVAGIRVDEGVESFAIQRGLFVLVPSGETVRLVNPKGFTPHIWRSK